MKDGDVSDTESGAEIYEETVAHDGFRRYAIYRLQHRAMDEPARLEAETSRECLRTHRAVAVLARDTKSGDLVMIRQFRLGAHLATGKGNLVEIAAGAVDPGETPETAARRELREETGLDALAIRHVADFLSSPGLTDEYVSLYLADVDASALPETVGHDEDEIIRPFRCRPEEAIAAADRGAIANAFALLALNWYDRFRRGMEKGKS